LPEKVTFLPFNCHRPQYTG